VPLGIGGDFAWIDGPLGIEDCKAVSCIIWETRAISFSVLGSELVTVADGTGIT